MQSIRQIVLTGPESTGKSTLSVQLAKSYHTYAVPEYAREYISNLKRPYTFSDIELIAQEQLNRGNELLKTANRFLFYDTHLIILKVWFLSRFKYYPQWIDDELRKKTVDLFLLCNYDIPWEPDPLRENGGEMRRLLFNVYKSEIEYYNYPYRIISGNTDERLARATIAINDFFD
jgi:nicotinamide riboside kinase